MTPIKDIYIDALRKRGNRVVIANSFAHYYYEQMDIDEDDTLDAVDHELLSKELELTGFAYCYSIFQLW